MKKKVIISSLLLSITLFVFSIPPADEGKVLFSSRCASCHNVNKVIVGPALAGVSERHTEDWIIHFVHSSQTVIKGGDKTAISLYEKFNKVPMPDHPDLSIENIRGILAYIKSETKESAAATIFRPDRIHPNYTPLSIITDYQFFGAYGVLILAMTVSLIALVRVKEVQRRQKDIS
jgi:cytochrome c551/c552